MLGDKYGAKPDDLISKFLRNTNYATSIHKFTPGLFEEVKGLSEASGVDFETIFAFQLMDEMLLSMGEISNEHCSTIGVNAAGGRPAYFAQTWDIGGYLDGYQTVLHIKHDNASLESFVFTYAGFIAAFGVNNHRVGVGVNGIAQLSSSRIGLPVAFVVRGLLETTNPEEAASFLHAVLHASPQTYVIAGPSKVAAFECSPNFIVPFANAECPNVVFHTNHPMVNRDFSAKYLKHLEGIDQAVLESDNSHSRLKSLQNQVQKTAGELDAAGLKKILSARDSGEHPICMGYVNDATIMNLGSTVMVLSDPPEFHVAFGPADSSPFMVHKFK